MTMACSNHIRQAFPNPQAFNNIYSLCHPALTEASFVTCHSDAFSTTVRRLLYQGRSDYDDEYASVECWLTTNMDLNASTTQLQRCSSHHSNSSAKSSRSQTIRVKHRKYSSYMSSSASSISDKSLTSFPSFSPESPREDRNLIVSAVDDAGIGSRKALNLNLSTVESLTTSDPLSQPRTALFDDAPLPVQHVPGALHLANDEHIERIIGRHGAVALVRQFAEDLALRDAQMASMRRKAEERERALRKIVLECGFSNLDLETRLRAIEGERKTSSSSSKRGSVTAETGLEYLMSDAMCEPVVLGELGSRDNEATIRAADALKALEDRPLNAPKGWKNFLWGGTSRKSSRATSVTEDINGADSAQSSASKARKTVLQEDFFQPPRPLRSVSQAASMASSQQPASAASSIRERKPSGLSSLVKLVAGSTPASIREMEPSNIGRGRSESNGTSSPGRAPSAASAKTAASTKAAPMKPVAKAIPRKGTLHSGPSATVRGPTQERWDTMGVSPQSTTPTGGADNYGPVEMDTILPPDAQPPTVTQVYNNPYNQEFLTDRFGFIYDQRRKKRQKEAAEKVQRNKRGNRLEMLSSSRGGISAAVVNEDTSNEDDRPDTPVSSEDRSEDGNPSKRWQDYLKIATFPTELLSHTPSGAVPAFEVMEGGETIIPRSPGIITEERGFLPLANNVAVRPAVSYTSNNATMSKPTSPSGPASSELMTEDAEPVKLLLQQLGEVHDSLQRDRTVRWNDFLRKVRAERKRDGEAAVAALVAAGNTQTQRPMPEASLTDGEMIGVAGLGNKGKEGRAKWNEFKTLVLCGIPVAYRAKIWAECSGATALRVPGYYDDLVSHPDMEDDPAITAQIQMDINRTLTDNIFFRKGPGVQKLSEVLLAYSRRNAEVGYCQGMNLITACLLLIMPTAEDAFWVLASIIENILPQGYYDHSLLASRADQQVLRQYVTEVLPRLSTHLDDLAIELEALTFQWFLSVFTDCLSAEALFRVWDVILCTNDGRTFLFQVALALLKLNEKELLGCDTPAGVYTYINHQMTNHAISIDGLIHASEGLRKVVKREEVENRRERAIENERLVGREREERNKARKAKRLAAMNEIATESDVDAPSLPPQAPGSDIQDNTDEPVDDSMFTDMSVRSPIPVDEERALGLG